eukprot:37274_1
MYEQRPPSAVARAMVHQTAITSTPNAVARAMVRQTVSMSNDLAGRRDVMYEQRPASAVARAMVRQTAITSNDLAGRHGVMNEQQPASAVARDMVRHKAISSTLGGTALDSGATAHRHFGLRGRVDNDRSFQLMREMSANHPRDNGFDRFRLRGRVGNDRSLQLVRELCRDDLGLGLGVDLLDGDYGEPIVTGQFGCDLFFLGAQSALSSEEFVV